MALGPGKYDAVCTLARESAKAEGVILIVFRGEFGSGFSAQAPAEVTAMMPQLLRKMADDVEASTPKA